MMSWLEVGNVFQSHNFKLLFCDEQDLVLWIAMVPREVILEEGTMYPTRGHPIVGYATRDCFNKVYRKELRDVASHSHMSGLHQLHRSDSGALTWKRSNVAKRSSKVSRTSGMSVQAPVAYVP